MIVCLLDTLAKSFLKVCTIAGPVSFGDFIFQFEEQFSDLEVAAEDVGRVDQVVRVSFCFQGTELDDCLADYVLLQNCRVVQGVCVLIHVVCCLGGQ